MPYSLVRQRRKPVYRVLFFDGSNFADNNATAAARFPQNQDRVVNAVALKGYTQVRFQTMRSNAAAAAGYTMSLRYFTSASSTASDYLTIGESAVEVNCVSANTHYDSGWINLVPGAIGDVFIALVAYGGDGTSDPNFGITAAEFR